MKKHFFAFSLIACAVSVTFPNQAFAVTLYGAGSLRQALGEVVQDFSTKNNIAVTTDFRPSDQQRDRILIGGERPDIFASADLGNPQKVYEQGLSSPVINFASNRLVAVTKSGLSLTSNNFLNQLLNLRIGTPPDSDPLGNYAQDIFKKADQIQPGSLQQLRANTAFFSATQPVDTSNSGLPWQAIPTNRNNAGGSIYYALVESLNPVDVFLAYNTSALLAEDISADLQVFELPENLAVTAYYGLTVLNNSSSEGRKIADYIASSDGQKVLAKYGFSPPSTSVPEPNTIGGVLLVFGLAVALKRKQTFVKKQVVKLGNE